MIDAATLLAMVESVNPTDSAALDALDCQVGNFLEQPLPLRYTRSRDALKSIRPEGLLVRIENWPIFSSVRGYFIHETGQCTRFDSGCGPTEELSELHVIIQAIEFRRRQSTIPS